MDHLNWPLYSKINQSAQIGPLSQGVLLEEFIEYVSKKGLSFYPAQEEAILELYSGKNVILSTPTGSGKSLVATAFHFLSMGMKRRSIYTCPIKALVNEKFLALCQDFGPDHVGMITGDATINPEAPIICCTAEILSNLCMRLGDATPFYDIIMDEFHYYSDRDRGMAWQIPLLVLKNARFLLMSATLGDTDFFEKALTSLTGALTVRIHSEDRPVPLEYEYSEKALHLKIADLIARKIAPIYLVHFTQRECAEVAQNLLSVDFNTKEEKLKISSLLEGTDFKSPYGKDIQRFLKHGVGLHHGGLLPKYRILVEKLAKQGVLKVICGTDTLGVGVNIPIRTVLFTKLCKYDGFKTTLLGVRDFKQISGRAGRRGFDTLGTVVVQAPEHVIENAALDEKAARDPKKAKKIMKRKPPEKGFIAWSRQTMDQLIQGKPEPLTSRFEVTHAMVLSVLSRENTKNGNALRNLIYSSHESDHQKKQHGKHAFKLFRSLVDRNIITFKPIRVNLELQDDFALNQTLSLYLIDTLKLIDLKDPEYALKLLTVAESILESPDLILRRQVDKLKTIRMQEMKLEGIEYEERIAKLEEIEHPKPLRDFIYDTFNAFSQAHPWVGVENIRPKSIAREMFESFYSFHEYITEYGLERVEGLLLRYLTDTYKVLIQTVPEEARTEEVLSVIEYFENILLNVDSSLMQEWETLKDPVKAAFKLQEKNDALQAIEVEKQRLLAIGKENSKRVISIRNEVFRGLRAMARQNLVTAMEIFSVSADVLNPLLETYYKDHKEIKVDQNSRSLKFSLVTPLNEEALNQREGTLQTRWRVEQTLSDIEDHNDWVLELGVQWSAQKLIFTWVGLRSI